MWELIQANKRKTVFLFIGLGICLVTFGYIVGVYLFKSAQGGLIGIIISLLIWAFMSIKSYFYGDSIILSSSRAKPLTKKMHPQLFNIVEEMTIAANLARRPTLYAIPSLTPNAFAVGIKEDESSIVVTTGLLAKLNRSELQGVIAHEMSHIINRDVLYMTFAQTLLSSILLMMSGSTTNDSSRRHRSYRMSTNKSSGGVLLLIIGLITAGVARMIYFSISRKREYLADATAVRLTRYPEGLASALEKIATDTGNLTVVNKMTAPLYIANPLDKFSSKTHPPLKERIKILRAICDGANYQHYQRAYNYITNNHSNIIPEQALDKASFVPLKEIESTASNKQVSQPNTADLKVERATQNLNRALDDFRFLLCDCGLKIKIPPGFKRNKVACPRCGRIHGLKNASTSPDTVSPYQVSPFDDNPNGTVINEINKEDVSSQTNNQSDVEIKDDILTYIRENPDTWDSFLCDCGHLVQLSPVFKAPTITCKGCGREIKIVDK